MLLTLSIPERCTFSLEPERGSLKTDISCIKLCLLSKKILSRKSNYYFFFLYFFPMLFLILQKVHCEASCGSLELKGLRKKSKRVETDLYYTLYDNKTFPNVTYHRHCFIIRAV